MSTPDRHIEIDAITTISRDPDFHGWPTIVRRHGDELLVAYSGGRYGHVCPFGQVHLIWSGDGGQSWSDPRIVADGPLDDRDAGVLETRAGTLLVSSFSYYNAANQEAWRRQVDDGQSYDLDPARLRAWRERYECLTPGMIREGLGLWMYRSTDGGQTWSARDIGISSPHGPIQLADGRLFYAGKQLWADAASAGSPFYCLGKHPEWSKRVNGIMVSADDGVTWDWTADLPAMPDHDPVQYHEWHAVETATGRIVAQCRNHNADHNLETLQCESADGGRTWTALHPIGVCGFPSHLLRLQDGRLLMSYTHRRAPWSCQVRVSDDQGPSWSDARVVSGADGRERDLGYPSTVELDDGKLLTVWYDQVEPGRKAVLRLARWRWA